VGATVAREMKVKVGDRIATTHGDPEGFGHGEHFTVVGILANSGTPQDRAVFVNMEGFFLMEGHAKPLDELPISEAHRAEVSGNEALSQEGWSGEVLSRQQQLALDPLPLEQRQVTSILVRTISPIVGPGLSNEINQGPIAQAVMPVREIYQLFNLFVRPAQMLLLLMSGLICIVSGVSILVSIYNSMSERRHEIAVMRALGAERQTVMTVILCESMILSLGGGMIGWVLGHGLNWAIGPLVEARTGVSIGFFDFAPGVDIGWIWGAAGARAFEVSTELLLVPALLLLAVIVGIFPALTAYRADRPRWASKHRSRSQATRGLAGPVTFGRRGGSQADGASGPRLRPSCSRCSRTCDRSGGAKRWNGSAIASSQTPRQAKAHLTPFRKADA
jgi:putative ABC transport system permease protein